MHTQEDYDDERRIESPMDPLFERFEAYAKVQLELIKYKSMHKGVQVISSMIAGFVVFSTLAFFLIFVSIALAIWLGELVGHAYWGFCLLALFYGLIAFIV